LLPANLAPRSKISFIPSFYILHKIDTAIVSVELFFYKGSDISLY